MRGEIGHFLKRMSEKKTVCFQVYITILPGNPRRECGPTQPLRDVMVVLING